MYFVFFFSTQNKQTIRYGCTGEAEQDHHEGRLHGAEDFLFCDGEGRPNSRIYRRRFFNKKIFCFILIGFPFRDSTNSMADSSSVTTHRPLRRNIMGL